MHVTQATKGYGYYVSMPASVVVGYTCAQIRWVKGLLGHPFAMGVSALSFLWGSVRLVRGGDFMQNAKILSVASFILGVNVAKILAEGRGFSGRRERVNAKEDGGVFIQGHNRAIKTRRSYERNSLHEDLIERKFLFALKTRRVKLNSLQYYQKVTELPKGKKRVTCACFEDGIYSLIERGGKKAQFDDDCTNFLRKKGFSQVSFGGF